MSLFLVIIPITIRLSSSEDQPGWVGDKADSSMPHVLALTEGNHWIEAPLLEEASPRRSAQQKIKELAPSLWEIPILAPPEPEPVGFTEDEQGNVRLIYTTATPITASFIPTTGELTWQDLHQITWDIPTRDLVRDHWRQVLEETTGAADLLPRYFSMSQLMDVYAAVWDKSKLDWTSFNRWVTDSNQGRFREVDRKTVQRESRETVAEVLGRQAPTGIVGASGVAISGAIPEAVAALGGLNLLAAAAGATAYHATRRGRPARWYQRADGGTRKPLAAIFQPRPSWQEPERAALPRRRK